MKNLLRSFMCVTLLSLVSAGAFADCGVNGCSTSGSTTTGTGCCNDCNSPKTLLIVRDQGANLVLDQHRMGYKYNEECCTYGEFGISYRYERNFKQARLAQSLFGTSTLNLVGSQNSTRQGTTPTVAANALLADYFGLATDENFSISFCPRIQNHIVDFRLYVGMDELCEGLYMQLNFPLAHSKWNLQGGCGDCCNSCNDCNSCNSCNSCCTTTTTTPATTPSTTLKTTPIPAGYMDTVAKGALTPLTTIQKALNGEAIGQKTAMKYGKFFGCCCDTTKLAGIYFDLGYNFYECPDYHLGIYAKVVAPTGTDMGCDTHAQSVFYPTIGDYHWQLGAGISGAAQLYNCDDEHMIDAYLQGYVTHLFDRSQVRSFDLKNGVMSRYMLLKEFKSKTDLTYNDKLYAAIDWTTRKPKVRVDVKGEGLLEFIYRNSCGFAAGLGYNIFGRSKEKICNNCCGDCCNSCFTQSTKVVGIKGCAPVDAEGYSTTAANPSLMGTDRGAFQVLNADVTATYHRINATQSAATAYKCGQVDNAITLDTSNAIAAGFVYVNPLNTVTIAAAPVPTIMKVEESATANPALAITAVAPYGVVSGITSAPKLLTDSDIDLCSGAMNGYVTHKIFGHLDYAWEDCDWKPAVYAGAEAEFASCSDKNAMNAWGIYLGGSLSF